MRDERLRQAERAVIENPGDPDAQRALSVAQVRTGAVTRADALSRLTTAMETRAACVLRSSGGIPLGPFKDGASYPEDIVMHWPHGGATLDPALLPQRSDPMPWFDPGRALCSHGASWWCLFPSRLQLDRIRRVTRQGSFVRFVVHQRVLGDDHGDSPLARWRFQTRVHIDIMGNLHWKVEKPAIYPVTMRASLLQAWMPPQGLHPDSLAAEQLRGMRR